MVALSIRALAFAALATTVVTNGEGTPKSGLLAHARRPVAASTKKQSESAADACTVKLQEAEKFLAEAAEIAKGSVSNGTGSRASRLAENTLKDHEEADNQRRKEITKLNSTLSALSSKARREEDILGTSMRSVTADITAIKRLKEEWGLGKKIPISRRQVLADAVGNAKRELDGLETSASSWKNEEKEVDQLAKRVQKTEQSYSFRHMMPVADATGLEEALGTAALHADSAATLTERVVSIIWRERAAIEELRNKRRELPALGRRRAIDGVITEVAALERLRVSATANRSVALENLRDDVTALGEATPPEIRVFLTSSTAASKEVDVALSEAQVRLDHCAKNSAVVIREASAHQQRVHAQLKRISKYRQAGVINPLDPRAVKTFGEQVFPGGAQNMHATMMNSAAKARSSSTVATSSGANSASDTDGMEDKLTTELKLLKNLYANKAEAQKSEVSQDVRLLNKHAEALPDEVADAVRRLAQELKDVQ